MPIIPEVFKYQPSKEASKQRQLKVVSDLMSRNDVGCVINACWRIWKQNCRNSFSLLSKIYSKSNIKVNAKQVIDNTKVSDHYAIIPTPTAATADLSGLPSGERKIFDMVALRLMQAVGDKHRYMK